MLPTNKTGTRQLKYYTFPCGCKFDIVGQFDDGRPRVKFIPDINKINLDCQMTWDMICSGDTKGVFQLESRHGQSLSERLKPRDIGQLAALSAIIRPACTEAFRDGKSITDHYVDRKNGEEEIEYYHPALESILKPTMGEMIYQESALQIVKDIAGFTLGEAEILRKAVGKKDTKKMAEVEEKFLAGCKKTQIVNNKEAEDIFSWIKASQRYGFNRCLSPTTLIETQSGDFISIEEVEIGTFIKTPEGYSKVVNKYNNGKKTVYKVILTCGKKIYCTLTHKFLCKDQQIRPIDKIYRDGFLKTEIKTVNGFSNIETMTYFGEIDTMDIEVDNNSHTFFGNGIATSNSHAVSYAFNGYLSAYCKAHFKKAFFTSYLQQAFRKPKPFLEIKALVNNAKRSNVQVNTPNIIHQNKTFKLIDGEIYFGLTDLKNVGNSAVKKIRQLIPDAEQRLGKTIASFSWVEFLVFASQGMGSAVVTSIIKSGGLDLFGLQRNRMEYEFNIYSRLKDREKLWVQCYVENTSVTNLISVLNHLTTVPAKRINQGCSSVKRVGAVETAVKQLENPSFSVDDTILQLSQDEEYCMGLPISCARVESCNISAANMTLLDFIKSPRKASNIIAVKIDEVTETKTIKGDKMAFLTASDKTAENTIVVFPEYWAEFSPVLYEENMIMVVGDLGKKNSFILKKAFQL